MRIGLFTDSYFPIINSVSVNVNTLKRALEKKGHQVFVVTTSTSNEKNKYKVENVINIPNAPQTLYSEGNVDFYPMRVINKIKKLKLDVIHSFTEFNAGFLARIISKQLDIPLIHTYSLLHGDYINDITEGYFSKSSKKLHDYMTLFYCDTTCDDLIFPNRKAWDFFYDKYKIDKCIHIIPNGINIEMFNNKIDKDTLVLKKKMSMNEDDFVLLYVGHLDKEKNVDFLIEQQKELAESIPNIKLLIIGEGSEKRHLISLSRRLGIDNTIIFNDSVPYDELPLYYKIADSFVTASEDNLQSTTIIEAMSSGLVPICIEDEFNNTFVTNNLNGLLFISKRSYKRNVVSLYNDKILYKRLSKQARISSEVYNSKYNVELILDTYKKIVKTNKKKNNIIRHMFTK